MKERLTGAIILVVLIVLLVPELLSGPKGPSAPAPAGVAPTSSEEPPLRSYTINLGDDSHSHTEAAGSNGPAMPQPSGPEQPAVPPSSAPTSATQSDGTSTPANAPNSVNVPAPANAPTPNARDAVHPPRAQTAHASVPTPSAAATRAPKATAQKPAKPHSAATPVAAATPSATESGWAVQLGVFASRENAERLALEVRVKGFKTSVSPVTSGTRKLYRVRVGPIPDRSAAQELQSRLKAAGRPGGTVVPYS